jgi:hypothetical protein
MISTNPALTYTATAPIFSLPVMTPTIFPLGATQTSIDPGTGWANTDDRQPLYTPAAGVAYPDAWGVTGETILRRAVQTPMPAVRRRTQDIR